MSYIGNEPIVSATRTVTEITATAGQTTFTANGGYTVGYLDVFVNGAQLQTTDFTASNGSTVVLGSACVSGDDVRLVAWGTFGLPSVSGNLIFAGVGQRILGEMSSSTIGNRVLAQTNTSNGNTTFGVIPNGTSQVAVFEAYSSSSDPANSSTLQMGVVGTTDARINARAIGTGTYLPLTMYTGGGERLRIDTSGNVGIKNSSPATYAGTGGTVLAISQQSTGATLASEATYSGYGQSITAALNMYQNSGNSYMRMFDICSFGDPAGAASQIRFLGQNYSGGSLSERMRLDHTGNVLVGTNSATNPPSTGYVSSANTFGFKNRIINGLFNIDQRANFTTVTVTGTGYVSADRWSEVASVTSKYSVTAINNGTNGSGYASYMRVTSLSAYSVLASDTFVLKQSIEGSNAADFAFGTAYAQPIAMSFWVRSSLTGTFGGVVAWGGVSGNERSYPFTYSIPVANTWTQIGILIPADTTASTNVFNTTTGIGFQVRWGLGVGTTGSGTPGSWTLANLNSATGAVSVLGTSGATWDITAVQFEKGTACTAFDVRSYQTELAMCQRYYNSAPFYVTVSTAPVESFYPVEMRTAPTIAGGGAGFTSNSTGGSKRLNCSQTTPADQTLTFTAEL